MPALEVFTAGLRSVVGDDFEFDGNGRAVLATESGRDFLLLLKNDSSLITFTCGIDHFMQPDAHDVREFALRENLYREFIDDFCLAIDLLGDRLLLVAAMPLASLAPSDVGLLIARMDYVAQHVENCLNGTLKSQSQANFTPAEDRPTEDDTAGSITHLV